MCVCVVCVCMRMLGGQPSLALPMSTSSNNQVSRLAVLPSRQCGGERLKGDERTAGWRTDAASPRHAGRWMAYLIGRRQPAYRLARPVVVRAQSAYTKKGKGGGILRRAREVRGYG